MEDYPGSLAEFEERFATEAACLEYLARLRWPDGFVCPQCYLDEFTFRFNRRTSRQRGKLFYRLVQQALMVDPVEENELKAVIPSEEDFDDLEF